MEVEIKSPPTPRVWKEDDESSINNSDRLLQNNLSQSTTNLKCFIELRKSKIKIIKISKSTKELCPHKYLKKNSNLSNINIDYINNIKEENDIEKFLIGKNTAFKGFDLSDDIL